MRKAFMIELELPESPTEEFFALIPRQRYVINNMLAEGRVKAYSLSLDRSRLWVVALAASEFEALELISEMPLSTYMTPLVSELMFHNTADQVLAFSLN